MIATSDIEDIVIGHCTEFGVIRAHGVDIDDKAGTGLTGEVIVVHVHAQYSGRLWEPCAVDVNFCVPDFKSGKRNKPRLQQIENMANAKFKDGVYGEYDNTPYLIEKISIGVENEANLKSHYVNLKINFQTLNTIQT